VQAEKQRKICRLHAGWGKGVPVGTIDLQPVIQTRGILQRWQPAFQEPVDNRHSNFCSLTSVPH
jgi:hypothetical protein